MIRKYEVPHDQYDFAREIYYLKLDEWRKGERQVPPPAKPVRPPGRPPKVEKAAKIKVPKIPRVNLLLSIDLDLVGAIEKLRNEESLQEAIRQLLQYSISRIETLPIVKVKKGQRVQLLLSLDIVLLLTIEKLRGEESLQEAIRQLLRHALGALAVPVH